MLKPPPDHPPFATLDCVDRFEAIHRALHTEREGPHDQRWIRCAAMALVPTMGEPEHVAHALRSYAAQLKHASHWSEPERGALRYLLAALVRPTGIVAEAFLAIAHRDHEHLRAAGLPVDYVNGACASAIRLLLGAPHELSALLALRIAHLQHALVPHGWHLESPRTLPLAVLLAMSHVDASTVGERVSRCQQACARAGLLSGASLHRACILLQLSGLEPAAAAARLSALATAFSERGSMLDGGEVEAMAMLCLLDHDPILIARVHQACAARLIGMHPPLRGQLAPVLAADLAFLELLPAPAAACEPQELRAVQTTAEAAQVLARLHRYHAVTALVHLDHLVDVEYQANLI